MSNSQNSDPELNSDDGAPTGNAHANTPDVEVTSAADVDPKDGTDQDDKPIDNPAG